MINQLFTFSLLLIFCISCNQPQEDTFGPLVSKYMPPIAVLKEGILLKFYRDTDREYDDRATEIYYHHIQLKDDTIHKQIFDAGLDLIGKKKILYRNDQFIITEDIEYSRLYDSFHSEIQDSTFVSWTKNQTTLRKSIYNNFNTRYYEMNQTGVIDSTIRNLDTKTFHYDRKFILEKSETRDTIMGIGTRSYAENLGLIDYTYIDSTITMHSYLVEQFDQESFERMRKNKLERVGFIKETNRFQYNKDFTLCKDLNRIVDYYNGNPEGHLQGKKNTIRLFLTKLLDPSILKGESGYLSVRFIINCEGEIGQFTVEDATLDYEKSTFKEETLQHIVDVTSQMKPWIPCTLNDETWDSYAYIMYKIKNGEIIEILP